MNARASREQAFWDEVYGRTGPEPAFLWMKHDQSVSYLNQCFVDRVGGLRGKRVLSLGGGVDRLGVRLARAGNRVVTVDVSAVAAAATAALAERAGAAGNLTYLVGAAEEVALEREAFDAVVCKRSLHHMDFAASVARAEDVLVPGGVLLAEEPVCLLRLFRWLHERLPFHPDATRSQDERELTAQDLDLVRRTFRTVQVSYFDFLARESVAHFFRKGRIDRLLNPLGRLDYFLLNRCLPGLRRLGTYVLIEARK
jgi:SAM-dependent methyltransferase